MEMVVALLFARSYSSLPSSWMERVGHCLRFTTAAHCYSGFVDPCATRNKSGSIFYSSHEGSPQGGQELFFSTPGEWRDNKGGPQHPDFRHKVRGHLLWLNNQCKPMWVGSAISRVYAHLQSSLGPSALGDKFYTLSQDGEPDRALAVLLLMDEYGIVPSVDFYKGLLKACTNRKALAHAKLVYAHMAKHGLESNKILGDFVVRSLVNCGGLEYAIQVFYRLPHRSVYSWTALISGRFMTGKAREALRMYQGMQEDGVQPDAYTFVSLVRACGSIGDLQEGKRIHEEVVRSRCESNLFIGACLVDMYAKCGSVADAQTVFDGLPQRDLVCWTALITAYGQQGQAEEAVQLYGQMREEAVSPDDRTFVSVLQACGILAEKEAGAVDGHLQSIRVKSLGMGKTLHAEAQVKGYDSVAFVGNALVSMYGKCGSILDAQSFFDELSQRDLVSWNTMLAACVQQGRFERALQLYEKMQEQSVTADVRTYVSVLQACGLLADKEDDEQSAKMKFLQKGKAIHADVRTRGNDSHVFISNTLVSIYAKCGSIVDAEIVFDRLSLRDVVSWNAMLTAYAQQQQQGEKVLELYETMLEEGVTPDMRTFISTLQACGMLAEKEDIMLSTKVNSLRRGKAIHAYLQQNAYDLNVFVGSTLISVFAKCGSILDSEHVFDLLPHKDVSLWNSMLAAYSQQGHADKALQLYRQMQEEGISTDNWTFVSALQACGLLGEKEKDDVVDAQSTKLKSLEKGRAVHGDALKKGYMSDVYIASALISMYGKCGSIVDAQNVFHGLPRGSVVTWNAMLSAYVGQGQGEKAFKLYRQMQEGGMSPDDITLVCILQACSNTGSLDVCRHIHQVLVSTRISLSPLLGNTLIHAYGKCATMVDAHTVFSSLPEPDVVAWTTLMAGYVREGNWAAVVQIYEEMRVAGVKPNGVTFLSLLSACSHAGLVDKGVDYFESMNREHGLTPAIEHYVSMVDLLGRAGCFTGIERLMSVMPMQPNVVFWYCLLGACRKHGNLMLGKLSFDRAVLQEPKHAGAYVLMAKIYSEAGLSDGKRSVDELRQKVGAWKRAGQSWIQHEQVVHHFAVGDCKHQQQKKLYNLLTKIDIDMKRNEHTGCRVGDVGDMCSVFIEGAVSINRHILL